jgi:hypothetical protein
MARQEQRLKEIFAITVPANINCDAAVGDGGWG